MISIAGWIVMGCELVSCPLAADGPAHEAGSLIKPRFNL
jgi:hypothetical protein